MKAFEIAAQLEEIAPCGLQESWDNSGFIIGNPDRDVTMLLIGLDCTEDLIDEAVTIGAEMIITHHPLIFKGVRNILSNNYLGRTIEKAIKNEIVIYAIHTNIDKIKEGVSGIMADKIELNNRVLLDDKDNSGFGLGIVGDLTTPLFFNDLAVTLKSKFKLSFIRHSKPLISPIKRVALCGGSGSSLISAAMKHNAQVLITGDISYHDFFCEEGFMVVDIGHFESEIDITEFIKRQLLKKIPNFAAVVSTRNYNPIHYF